MAVDFSLLLNQVNFNQISFTTILPLAIGLIILLFAKNLVQIWSWINDNRKIVQAVQKLPGPKAHWLWGNILQYPPPGEKSIAWSEDMNRQFPRYMKFMVGRWFGLVILRHPDYIKQILKTSVVQDI